MEMSFGMFIFLIATLKMDIIYTLFFPTKKAKEESMPFLRGILCLDLNDNAKSGVAILLGWWRMRSCGSELPSASQPTLK